MGPGPRRQAPLLEGSCPALRGDMLAVQRVLRHPPTPSTPAPLHLLHGGPASSCSVCFLFLRPSPGTASSSQGPLLVLDLQQRGAGRALSARASPGASLSVAHSFILNRGVCGVCGDAPSLSAPSLS